jgi:hypothetical protein
MPTCQAVSDKVSAFAAGAALEVAAFRTPVRASTLTAGLEVRRIDVPILDAPQQSSSERE